MANIVLYKYRYRNGTWDYAAFAYTHLQVRDGMHTYSNAERSESISLFDWQVFDVDTLAWR